MNPTRSVPERPRATRAARSAASFTSWRMRLASSKNSLPAALNLTVVPVSFRQFREQQPDAELQLQPAPSLEQFEAVRSGRLDAGFINFMPKSDPELDQLRVAIQHIELAVPRRHPLTKLKKLRLRDLTDVPFVWFPRWACQLGSRAMPITFITVRCRKG